MTYKEKLTELRKEFVTKAEKYLRADREISEVDGFGDIALLENFARAKRELEVCGNNYHAFLIYASKTNANPEDEFRH